MSSRRWEQVGAATGVVFVALFLLGGLSFVTLPADDAKASEWLAHWSGDRIRSRAIIAALMWALAGGAFVWFAGSLRSFLRRAENDESRLSAVAFGGGVVFAAGLTAAAAAHATVPAAIEFFDNFTLEANTAMLFAGLTYWLVSMAAVGAAVLVTASSVIALRTGVFVRSFAWTGFVVALGGLATAATGVSILLVLAWVLTVAVALMRRRTPADTA